MTEPVRTASASPVRLEHELCVLELPADFRVVPGLDEYQFSFESPSRKASVVLSILPVDIPPTGLQAFAEIFVLTRKATEMEARSNCRLDEEESALFDDSMAHVRLHGRHQRLALHGLGHRLQVRQPVGRHGGRRDGSLRASRQRGLRRLEALTPSLLGFQPPSSGA